MKKGAYLCPPPDDGREWILADDAAKLYGVTRDRILKRQKHFQWTKYRKPGKQTWLLKSDLMRWYNFLKDRERWYKRRLPKTWQPMVSMERKENEWKFADYWWTTAQAAAYMGVSECTIYKWTKQGKVPMFTTRKMGMGGKYWYSPTFMRNLKESEEWQEGRAKWEKAKATMRQGIVGREVYTTHHNPYIYQGVPPGWITIREVAERLQISQTAAYRLRRMNRFMSEQFVGEWDTKNRPWFCDEDGVEAYKNSEEYQKLRQRGMHVIQTIIGKPPCDASPPVEETYQPVTLTRQHDITFGYTNEELKMPHLRVTGVNEMW